MPTNLSIVMIERIGLIVGLAYLATRSRAFRFQATGQARWPERLQLILIFGLFGIFGTYTGVVVNPGGVSWGALVSGPLQPEDAIANSRAVSVIVAGLLGGPWVGLGAGLVAGVHRLFVGGFTALACGLATALEGLLSGWLWKRLPRSDSFGPHAGWSFLVAALMEVLQMVLILLVARPFSAALDLVRLIALPMALANGLGVALFLVVTRGIMTSEAAKEGDAARKALLIATRTLPFLRRGLTMESAEAAARVIHKETCATAVAITDERQILAHVGLGEDHHRPGVPVLTKVTRMALQQGRLIVAEDRAQIECRDPSCPLQGVVVVPLREDERVVGTLKLYFDHTSALPPLELAEGLGYHVSTQLAVARASEQSALLAKAEIRALQAQIQPHFLFNALNTIMALIRRDPDRARDVLGHLADFLRRNLQSTQVETITLGQELEHVRDYLTVEQARFSDHLSVTYDVEEALLPARIPPLTLQPLVENALVHGLKAVRHPGRIHISASARDGVGIVTVADNGRGIPTERIGELLERPVQSQAGTGLALHNVHQRLRGLFGAGAGLTLDSSEGEGTTVYVRFPVQTSAEEEDDADTRTGSR